MLANQDIYVSARNKAEARKKIKEKFRRNPGKPEIVDIEEID